MTHTTPFSLSEKSSFIFLISLIAIFSIGVLAPRTMAFLPIIMSAGFFLFCYFANKQIVKIPKAELILFGILLLLSFASSLWAINSEFVIEKSFKLLGMFLPGLTLISLARHIKWPDTNIVVKTLIGAIIVLLIFLISEKLTDHQIIAAITREEVFSFKLNRAFVVLSLFLVPTFFLIAKIDIKKIVKTIILTFMGAGTLFAFYLTESQTAQLCLLVGIFFLYIFPIKIKFLTKALMVISVIFCLIFPFTISTIKSSIPENTLKSKNYFINQTSFRYRLDIWNYAAEKTLESPIYGNGIGSLRFMKGTYMENQRANNALHAHNSVLQIWAEFGVIGIFLACAFLIYIFRKIEKIDNHNVRRLYLASFLTCFCCSLTGYGVWQGWQLGLFFAATAFTLAVGQKYLKQG